MHSKVLKFRGVSNDYAQKAAHLEVIIKEYHINVLNGAGSTHDLMVPVIYVAPILTWETAPAFIKKADKLIPVYFDRYHESKKPEDKKCLVFDMSKVENVRTIGLAAILQVYSDLYAKNILDHNDELAIIDGKSKRVKIVAEFTHLDNVPLMGIYQNLERFVEDSRCFGKQQCSRGQQNY